MSIRTRPVVEVDVYEEQPFGPMLYPAYGGRHRVYELSRRDIDPDGRKKNIIINPVSAEELGQAGGSGGTYFQGHTYYEGVKFIGPPVEAAIAYPMIDRSQHIGLSYFTAQGYAQQYWCDGVDGSYFTHLDQTAVLMYNYYGSQIPEGQQLGLWSKFSYPANPIICLAIVRAEPPPQFSVYKNPATTVVFGYNSGICFVLSIPYEYPPTLYVRHPVFTGGKFVAVQAMGDSSPIQTSGDPSYRGGSGTAAKQLWIGAFGGGIAVSEDCFDTMQFFPLRWSEPTAQYPYGATMMVPSGPIGIYHNAGQFATAVLPVKMPTRGVIQGPVEETQYDIVNPWHYTAQLPWLQFRQQPVYDDSGNPIAYVSGSHTLGPTLEPDAYSRIPAGRTAYEWRSNLPAVQRSQVISGSNLSTAHPEYFNTPLTFKTCVSPVLYDVIYAQPAILRSPATVSHAAKEVKDFTIQRGEDLGATGDFTLDNQLNQESAIVTADKPLAVTAMGYSLSDTEGVVYPEDSDLRALFSGYAVPSSSGAEGKVELKMEMFDIARYLQDTRKLSDTFPLDGLLTNYAIGYAASWAGIMSSQLDLEDLNTRLNAGPWDQELYWYTDSSENILNLIEEMCVYDYNAGLWISEEGKLTKGCRFCYTKRTASDVGSHFGNGLASPACLANDITSSLDGSGIHFRFFTGVKYKHLVTDLVGDEFTNMSEVYTIEKPAMEVDSRFYNSVRIKGPTYGRKKDSETVDWTDWASVAGDKANIPAWGYALGYKKTLEKTYGWAVTHSLRDIVAYTLFDSLRVKPDYRNLTVPYLPEIRRGNVIQVYGNLADQFDMSGKDYRVTAYGHSPRSAGRERSTTITCRYMRDTVVP